MSKWSNLFWVFAVVLMAVGAFPAATEAQDDDPTLPAIPACMCCLACIWNTVFGDGVLCDDLTGGFMCQACMAEEEHVSCHLLLRTCGDDDVDAIPPMFANASSRAQRLVVAQALRRLEAGLPFTPAWRDWVKLALRTPEGARVPAAPSGGV